MLQGIFDSPSLIFVGCRTLCVACRQLHKYHIREQWLGIQQQKSESALDVSRYLFRERPLRTSQEKGSINCFTNSRTKERERFLGAFLPPLWIAFAATADHLIFSWPFPPEVRIPLNPECDVWRDKRKDENRMLHFCAIILKMKEQKHLFRVFAFLQYINMVYL